MTGNLYKFTLGLALFFTFSLTAQDIFFEVKVSQNKVAEGETFKLEYISNGSISHFQPPSLSNFHILSGPNRSSSYSYVNGKATRRQSYSYRLQPIKKGNLTINAATAEINGQTYSSQPVSIEVLSSKSRSTPNGTPANGQDVLLMISASKRNVYINEPIVLTYKVLFNKQISSPSVVKEPQLDGFWITEIKEQRTSYNIYKTEYKGKMYHTFDFHSFVIIPQKTGKLKIPSYVLNTPVEITTNKRDWFGMPITKTENVLIQSKPVTIRVRPLPTIKRGETFHGAVGRFTTKSKLDRYSVTSGEAITITYEIFGKGNLEMLQFAPYVLGQQFETFEPEIKSDLKYTKYGAEGKVTYSQVVIPRFSGSFTLPPVKVNYFDPKSKRYKYTSSSSFKIQVAEGKKYNKQISSSSIPTEQIESQVNKSLNEDILFIQRDNNLSQTEREPLFSFSTAHWTSMAIPYLLSAIWLMWGLVAHRLAGTDTFEGVKLNAKQRKALQKLVRISKTEDEELFWQQAHNVILLYLQTKLKINLSELSNQAITALATEGKIDPSKATQIVEMIETINLQRFAPASQKLPKNEMITLITQIIK